MDKLGEALIEIARQGGPIAQSLVIYYYVYWTITAFLVSATVIGVAIGVAKIVTSCILTFQDRNLKARYNK